MFVYFFHRSVRRDYAKMCKLMSEEDVESGYPEEMFVTETTVELIPSPPPPPPGKTAKLSGTECNCHQLSSFLNNFIAEISNVGLISKHGGRYKARANKEKMSLHQE